MEHKQPSNNKTTTTKDQSPCISTRNEVLMAVCYKNQLHVKLHIIYMVYSLYAWLKLLTHELM